MPKIIPEMHIFRAVMETIAQRGYIGATTRQIADAAGIGEVTLFRKYGTKTELVKRAISALIEQTGFEAATRYTGDLRGDLLRVLLAYQQSVISNGQFFVAIFSELLASQESSELFDQPVDVFHSIGQLLARYQAEGRLQPENPFHSVAALLGPLIYLSMIGRAPAVGQIPPLDLETHIYLFLQGRQRAT